MQPLTTKEQLELLAAKQGGRLAKRQLSEHGISRGLIRSWVRKRVLIPTAPNVFALGYARTDRSARIWDAVLYAGPGGYLTGACGAYELGLLFYEPRVIKVGTPNQRRLIIPGAVVLNERPTEREVHDHLPYAAMVDLLMELAAEGNIPILRRTLEVLDYQRTLDMAAAHHACRHGRTGSTQLKHALTHRLPQLAFCKSPMEVDFLILLDAHHLPLPLVNQRVHGVEPDMYWPHLNLVVELDGDANHHSAAQKRRDAEKDALLRSHGLTVIRLDHDDVHQLQSETLMTLAGYGVIEATN